MRLYKNADTAQPCYTIQMYQTLFDDFLVQHHCGKRRCQFQSRREYFPSKKEALIHSLGLIDSKRREGYHLLKATPAQT